MGKRGPRPLPTAVLQARGSRRAKANKLEPEPPAGLPECPDWLSDDAKAVWSQITPILQKMGVLTIADGNALARYCTALAQWREAEMFLQKYGLTYPVKSGNGTVKCFFQWPQVAIVQKLSLVLTRLEQEFGLTPSARTRIEIDPGFKPKRQSDFYRRYIAPFPETPASLIEEAERQRKREEFFKPPAPRPAPPGDD